MSHAPIQRLLSVAVAVLTTVATATVVLATQRPAAALDNSTARTPPMGWNTWNTFGCNINESLIRGMADAMVSSGMREAGYQYVVVDDCWFNPNRDSAGNLQGDPSRFPSGMKALGDYLHTKGLKFGIYQGPLDKTCAQYFNSYPGATGSGGHETADAKQFAAWGVDYLKYDWCSPNGTINDQVTTFAKMRDALAATGRPIVYSINSNSVHAKTGPQRNWGDVANLWRTTEDITNKWDTGQTNGYPMGIQNIVNVTVPLASYAKPGAWNDPDMMEIGRGGMTDAEMRSHFALWAMMASPLIAGNDLRSMDQATQTILKNANLIAIDQDSLGQQATQVAGDGTRRILAKKLSNGDVAVALFNQSASTTTISTTAAAIGLSGSTFTLRDAWSNTTTASTGTISASVAAHATVVYRVTRTGSNPSSTSPSSSNPSPQPSGSSPSSTTSPPAAGCRISVTVSTWNTGLTEEITMSNTSGVPVSGWSLRFTLPSGQTVTSAWNTTVAPTSGQVTATDVSYNATIAAGASVSFGFQATHTGNTAKPTAFALNGTACTPA